MKSFPLSVLTFLGHISQEAPMSQEWGNDRVFFFFCMVSLLWNTSVLSLTSINKILESKETNFPLMFIDYITVAKVRCIQGLGSDINAEWDGPIERWEALTGTS